MNNGSGCGCGGCGTHHSGNCGGCGIAQTTNIYEGDEFVQALTFKIEGMSCNHCANHAKQALEAIPGVTSVDIDLESKMASVFGENLVEETLFKAVSDAGYTAK